MNLKPLVTIIIPTYNRANMVANAIQSALNQNYPNKEIIVVDDGSADDTKEVVQSFPDVVYIHQNHAGQAAARNKGWKNAKGVYISTLDSDDVWYPGFLETCIEVLERNNLDFVFTNWEQERMEGGLMDFFSCDENLKPYLPKAIDSWVFLEYEQLRDLYIKSCPSPSSSLVLRSSSITNGWNQEMNIGDDWCMLMDLILSKKAKAAFSTQKLWLKHVNCNNLFDGRSYVEVIKFLWVKDYHAMIARHRKAFTKKEYQVIQKIYLWNLVHDAKHSLLIYSNLLESISSMRKAMFANPLYTSKVFSKIFIEAAKRRLKSNTQ